MASGTEPAAAGDQSSPRWQAVDTLGLADVVMTILKARKALPSATAAAISRERQDGAFHVHVSLLSNVPRHAGESAPDTPGAHGSGVVVAHFAARQLAADLADVFADNDVIILK